MGENEQVPIELEIKPGPFVPGPMVVIPDIKNMNIYQRMHAIQGEIEDMKKEGWNDFSHYQYLTAAQVVSRVKELMDKYRMIFIPTDNEILGFEEVGKSQKGVKLRIKYQFRNVDEPLEVIAGSFDSFAGDTGDKQVFKAVTGGIKYIYTSTFNIANEDDPEKDKQGNKKAAPVPAQTAEMVVGQIKIFLHKKDSTIDNEAKALTLFRKLTGLNWMTFKGITLAQAKAGQLALLSNATKK